MKTILVTGASGIVGYGILRSLKKSTENLNLIGTSIYSDSIAPAFCDIFEKAPPTNEDSYINWLIGLIKKYNIDLIIPGIEADMFKWNEKRKEIEATTTIKILLNNPSLIELCKDKWNFYLKLIDSGSSLAINSVVDGGYCALKEKYGVPFLLKPRRSSASRGIITVDSNAVFNQHKKNLGGVLLAQPIIGSAEQEFSTSAFFDKNSKLCSYMSIRRKLSKEGFTEKAEVKDHIGISKALDELSKIFKPIGPTNFQFRVDKDNSLKLLEINPRISSATSIRAAFGFNESLMSVDYFLNSRLTENLVLKKGVAIRYTEDYIFYDRDSL